MSTTKTVVLNGATFLETQLPTLESKEKGDAGIFAALDAMHLAHALRGMTNSRLAFYTLLGAPRPNETVSRQKTNENGERQPQRETFFGVEPTAFHHFITTEVEASIAEGLARAVQQTGEDPATTTAVQRAVAGTTTTVGLPESIEAIRPLLPVIRDVKPEAPMSYADLQQLVALLELHGTCISGLFLNDGVLNPNTQPPPSTEVLGSKMEELKQQYPLASPVKPQHPASDSDDSDPDRDEEMEDGDAEDAVHHNSALRARCEELGLGYTDYDTAIRDVARHEMKVFLQLCRYLATASSATPARPPASVKILDLSANNIAKPSGGSEGSEDGEARAIYLAPLRALAAMIDENECMRYLNLRQNSLGPRGFGIIGKALTKNIALCGIDLSYNGLGAEPGDEEEVEDPEYVEEDPMFGETYAGLEAISEVLKKNKFLRVLRLAGNGIHAGEDLTVPPPESDDDGDEAEEMENGGGATATAVNANGSVLEGQHEAAKSVASHMSPEAAAEEWQGLPLWMLVSPLMKYHRLRVLDLSGNRLGSFGARILGVALSHNRSIEVLDLTDNHIGCRGLAQFARYALTAPTSQLRTLILRRNGLGCQEPGKRLPKRKLKRAIAAMEVFAATLVGHDKLRCLVLSNNYLGPVLSSIILRGVSQMVRLEELDFSHNSACGDHAVGFEVTAAHHLATALYQRSAHHPSTIRRLRLDGNNITAIGLAALFPDMGIALPSSLEELSLSRNSLGDALQPLSTLLALASTTLRRLDLSFNGITSLRQLFVGLAQSESLVELDVSHNKLGVMEEAVCRCPAAQQIEGVTQFLQLVASKNSFAILNMSWNDLQPAHADQVAAIFAQPLVCPSLKKIDLRDNPSIRTAQLMTLIHHVGGRPGMEVLHASLPPENAKGGGDGEWTREAILHVVHDVVRDSASLLDIYCALREPSPNDDLENREKCSKLVGEIQQRLLLNALCTTQK